MSLYVIHPPRNKKPADQFQKLPDELLTLISSMLPIQEAARTSVLARRWRYKWKELPNPHFDGNTSTRFSESSCPVSCFDSLDKFLNWMAEFILQIEQQSNKGDDFWIESLGLNFGEQECYKDRSWIELNRELPPVVGGFRLLSFMSSSSPSHRRISDVFTGGKLRPNLRRNLTLQNCGMETLEKNLGTGCLRSLKSLFIQFGESLDGGFVSDLISGCPSLETVEFHGCSFVFRHIPSPVLVVRTSSASSCLKRVKLFRCTGVAGMSLYHGSQLIGEARMAAALPEATAAAVERVFSFNLNKNASKVRNYLAKGPVVAGVAPRRPPPPAPAAVHLSQLLRTLVTPRRHPPPPTRAAVHLSPLIRTQVTHGRIQRIHFSVIQRDWMGSKRMIAALQEQDQEEQETILTREDEVAHNYFDRLDHKFKQCSF